MKLHWSAASPYVRKVMACAVARGIEARIGTVPANPHVSPPGLLADNPLSKVPCLVLDDGTPLFGSAVICEALDRVGDAPPLLPDWTPGGGPGGPRLRALRLQAMADGILDAAVARRLSAPHPQDEGRRAFDARQRAAVDRTLDALEADPPSGLADLGALSVGCALGYLDFRFAAEPWREGRAALAAWYAAASALPPLARTEPVG